MEDIEEEMNGNTVDFDERLPLKSKIAYGLSQASMTLLVGIALGSAITFYYNVKLGLSEELISLAWLLFAFWNCKFRFKNGSKSLRLNIRYYPVDSKQPDEIVTNLTNILRYALGVSLAD